MILLFNLHIILSIWITCALSRSGFLKFLEYKIDFYFFVTSSFLKQYRDLIQIKVSQFILHYILYNYQELFNTSTIRSYTSCTISLSRLTSC